MKAEFPNIAISFEAQIAIPPLVPATVLREAAVCMDRGVDTCLPQEHGGGTFPASGGDSPWPWAIPALDGYFGCIY